MLLELMEMFLEMLLHCSSVAVSFLWLHLIWALPPNIAVDGNAVFPPPGLGSKVVTAGAAEAAPLFRVFFVFFFLAHYN